MLRIYQWVSEEIGLLDFEEHFGIVEARFAEGIEIGCCRGSLTCVPF